MATLDFSPWPNEFAKSYRERGFWIDRPLTDILDAQRLAQPDSVALVGSEQTLTFKQLSDQARALAGFLWQNGLRPGDKALVQLPNAPVFYVTFWALLTIGVRPVFSLFNHSSLELMGFSKQLKPKLLILSGKHPLFVKDCEFSAALKSEAEAEVVLFSDVTSGLAECGYLGLEEALANSVGHLNRATLDELVEANQQLDAGDVAFFQLSGGSTNTPKLIPRTHNDYFYSIRRSAEVCELDEKTSYLCALPAAHNFPMSSPGALGVWYAGGCVVMAKDPSPLTCFPLIKTHKITMTSLVPPMVVLWLSAVESDRESLASLKFLQVGGAKLSEQVAGRIEAGLGCRLQQVFGMAEGLVCYTRLDADEWHRYHTQGAPMSDADEIRIVDNDGHPVEIGQEGQLLTRGPYTFRGYYQSEDHNLKAFDQEGFYRTGDLVLMTPSGSLIVKGRQKDQINRGGEKIAAEEVENLLLKCDGILQAAVVAMPDTVYGEKSCAFIVCRDIQPKDYVIRKHLRSCGIADFKLPDKFVRLDVLPLTAVGKPDKKMLRHICEREESRGDS